MLRSSLRISIAFLATATLGMPPVRADIFRWDNNQVVPGTAGIVLAPGLNLSNWNTPGHQLEFANFSANINGANLSGSDLNNALFPSATASIGGVIFTNATVQGTNFSGMTVHGFSLSQLTSTASYAAKTLNGIILNNNTMSGWDFSGQDLTNASFVSATLTNAKFNNANLTNANLSGANIGGGVFTGANLNNANIAGANMQNVMNQGFTISMLMSTGSYTAGNLSGINFTLDSLAGADLSHQNLSAAIFTNASLQNANLTGANLTGARFSSANLSNANVTGVNFSGTLAKGLSFNLFKVTANYVNHTLSGISLASNTFDPSWSFVGQDLSSADFSKSDIIHVDFLGATVANAKISGTTLACGPSTIGAVAGWTPAQLYSTANFLNNDFNGVTFAYSDLGGFSFAGKNLTGVVFKNCILANVDFSNTTLVKSTFSNITGPINFSNYTLTGALFTGPLNNVDFTNANLTGARFQIAGSALFKNANLTNADFSSADLSKADLTDANISNANLFGAKGFTAARLYSTASYKSKDLRGIRFGTLNSPTPTDFTGWNFSNQNLTGAEWIISDLSNADFTDAELNGVVIYLSIGFSPAQLYSTADYKSGVLKGMDFPMPDQTSWNFSNMRLEGVVFNGLNTAVTVDLTNSLIQGGGVADPTYRLSQYGAWFTKSHLYSTASYSQKNLSYILFQSNDLSGADLSNQDMTSCWFISVDLTNADFTGANISSARFEFVTGFTASQLYSTASYANHDLSSIWFGDPFGTPTDYSGWNFSGQNLMSTEFPNTILTNTDFSDADLRSARNWTPGASTITTNTIYPDGSIPNFALVTGETLVVRPSAVSVTISGPASIAMGATLQINGSQVTIASSLVHNGTINITSPDAHLLIQGPVTGNGSIAIDAGSLKFGATVAPRNDAGVLVKVKTLTMGPGATLDITNHDLFIGNSDLSTINTAIKNGLGFGDPAGPQITSSTADLLAGNTFLVPISADTILGNGTAGSAIGQTWDNAPITEPNTTIIKYTWFGDINLDGLVNGDDLIAVLGNLNTSTPGFNDIGTSWINGDTNLDGTINGDDLIAVLGNINHPGSPTGTLDLAPETPAVPSSPNPVPEPTTAALLLSLSPLLLRRAKRLQGGSSQS